jgi:hypothetical protein
VLFRSLVAGLYLVANNSFAPINKYTSLTDVAIGLPAGTQTTFADEFIETHAFLIFKTMIKIKRGKSIRPILFVVRRRYVGVGRKYLWS